jgi:hypothetical protein
MLLIRNYASPRTHPLGRLVRGNGAECTPAMIYGSVLASFCVESFSLERLRKLSLDEINERYEMFKLMSQFEVEI